jgi:hypothetical protein
MPTACTVPRGIPEDAAQPLSLCLIGGFADSAAVSLLRRESLGDTQSHHAWRVCTVPWT